LEKIFEIDREIPLTRIFFKIDRENLEFLTKISFHRNWFLQIVLRWMLRNRRGKTGRMSGPASRLSSLVAPAWSLSKSKSRARNRRRLSRKLFSR
jgi:hypothetical protein